MAKRKSDPGSCSSTIPQRTLRSGRAKANDAPTSPTSRKDEPKKVVPSKKVRRSPAPTVPKASLPVEDDTVDAAPAKRKTADKRVLPTAQSAPAPTVPKASLPVEDDTVDAAPAKRKTADKRVLPTAQSAPAPTVPKASLPVEDESTSSSLVDGTSPTICAPSAPSTPVSSTLSTVLNVEDPASSSLATCSVSVQRAKSPSAHTPTSGSAVFVDDPYAAVRRAATTTVDEGDESLPSTATAKEKKKRAPMENRSPFLKFFVVCPTDPASLDCILCGHTTKYLHGSRKVTSGMKFHLSGTHPLQYGEVASQEGRHVAAKQWLVRAIATGSLPFHIAQNVEIREFLSCLDPTFIVPDRKTLSGTILEAEYVVARQSVCDAVRGENISLTMDHWTSKDSNQSVMGSTAHLITPEWKRELFVLTLDEIDGAHNSDQVSKFLADIKKEFSLGSIYCCVSDSASVMVAGTAKGGVDRVGCVLHATHLFIMESIDGWQPAMDIVSAIRKIAAHVHRSRKSWLALLSALDAVNSANKKKIPMEIRIRWGSMLRMLKVAADQIDQLSDLAREHGFPVLDDAQKMTLKRLVEFLTTVDSFSATMSTHTATLSSVIPYLRGLENSLGGYSSSSLQDFVPILQRNFSKRFSVYFENEFAKKSLLVDPRFLYWGTLLETNDEEEMLEKLFKEADDGYDDAEEASAPPPKRARPSLLSSIAPKLNPVPSGARMEYEKLLSVAKRLQFPEEKDPVDFWRENHKLFPRLAKTARALLAIPPSSIDSERLFSTVGLVVNNRLRTRTTSNKMKKLAFVGAHSRRQRIRFRPEEWETYFDGDSDGDSDSLPLDDLS